MASAEIRIAEMARIEAEQKTERILQNFGENRRLIKEMHDRRGWKSLEYASFDEWGQDRLGLSRDELYRDMQYGRIEVCLSENSDKQTSIRDSHARPMTALIDREDAREKIRDAWDLANERTNGKPTGAAVKEAVDIVLGCNDPLPGQTSFFGEEDEPESEPLRPPVPSDAERAAEAWTELLTHFSHVWTSLKRRGGICQLSRRWTPDRKRGYVERCREISGIFLDIASELEAELR